MWDQETNMHQTVQVNQHSDKTAFNTYCQLGLYKQDDTAYRIDDHHDMRPALNFKTTFISWYHLTFTYDP